MSTTTCPVGWRCESCGAAGPDLVAVERQTGHGAPYCLTQCPTCARSTVPPPIQPGTRDRFVQQHAAHLNGAAS